MKIKVSKTIIEEVDIEFPFYVDYGEGFYKVLNENEYIHVCGEVDKFFIVKSDTSSKSLVDLFIRNGTQVPENIFVNEMLKAQQLVNDLCQQPKF